MHEKVKEKFGYEVGEFGHGELDALLVCFCLIEVFNMYMRLLWDSIESLKVEILWLCTCQIRPCMDCVC